MLASNTRPCLPNLTVVVDKQKWNAQDVQSGSGLRARIGIELANPDLSFGIGGKLIYDRTDRRAGGS